MSSVVEYAAANGLSDRRVRALASAGTIPAHRAGRRWVIDGPLERAATHTPRRPMNETMRRKLIHALRDQSLAGLTGADRVRVANHLSALRAADNPATLLREWFRHEHPEGYAPGELMVRQAHQGLDERVSTLVKRPRRIFAATPELLARGVTDERAIQHLGRAELAERAHVPAELISDVERARPVDDIGAVRRLLRTLRLEPLALPAVLVPR